MENEYKYPPRMKWKDKIDELEKENAELKTENSYLKEEIVNLEDTIVYLTEKEH